MDENQCSAILKNAAILKLVKRNFQFFKIYTKCGKKQKKSDALPHIAN
jgi:hypothetical protein